MPSLIVVVLAYFLFSGLVDAFNMRQLAPFLTGNLLFIFFLVAWLMPDLELPIAGVGGGQSAELGLVLLMTLGTGYVLLRNLSTREHQAIWRAHPRRVVGAVVCFLVFILLTVWAASDTAQTVGIPLLAANVLYLLVFPDTPWDGEVRRERPGIGSLTRIRLGEAGRTAVLDLLLLGLQAVLYLVLPVLWSADCLELTLAAVTQFMDKRPAAGGVELFLLAKVLLGPVLLAAGLGTVYLQSRELGRAISSRFGLPQRLIVLEIAVLVVTLTWLVMTTAPQVEDLQEPMRLIAMALTLWLAVSALGVHRERESHMGGASPRGQ